MRPLRILAALASASLLAVGVVSLPIAPASDAAAWNFDDECSTLGGAGLVAAVGASSVTFHGPAGAYGYDANARFTYVVDGQSQTTTSAPVTFEGLPPGQVWVDFIAESGAIDEASFTVHVGDSRISGPSRYDTAVAVGIESNPMGCASTVFLANGERFADALSGVPLAALHPHDELLLTPRDRLPESVLAEILDSGAGSITLLGGESVLSSALCDQVAAYGLWCTRIAGRDRYETSMRIVEWWLSANGGAYLSRDLVVVTGENFPDAISGGVLAASLRTPVLLVPGHAQGLSPEVASFIEGRVYGTVYVVGGAQSVSDALATQIDDLMGNGPHVLRISGPDRFATSAAVVERMTTWAGVTPPTALIATGLSFPDALTGGVLAARSGYPLALVQPTCMPQSVAAAFDAASVDSTIAIGGRVAVSDAAHSTIC